MHFREYIKATGISVFFTFAIFLIEPVLAPYIKSLGFDNFQLGLIFSVMPLAIIFFSPIFGKLADDIGKLRIIIFGLMIQLLAIIIYLSGTSWSLIAFARILDALAITIVTLIALAKVEDHLSDKDRGKYSGISLSIQYIGAIIAPVLGGVLADKLFVKAPFLLTAFLLILLSFILVFRNPKLRKKIHKDDFNFLDSLKNFLSIRPLRGMAILGFVAHASQPAIKVFLPLFIIEKLNLGYSFIGVAIFFIGIAHLFQFYFGHLADKFGRSKVMFVGILIYSFSLLLLAFASNYTILLVILFFLGIGSSIWNVSAWTLMSDIGERLNKEAEVVCSYMSLAKIGGFLSYIFSGLIVDIYGFGVLFVVNGLLLFLGLIVSFKFFKGSHSEALSDDYGLTL